MSAAPDLSALRQRLETRFGEAILPFPGSPPPAPRRNGVRLGVPSLESLLPEGLARGALSLWTGEGTSGRSALLRVTLGTAVGDGAWVALVDAEGSLAPDAWCTPSGPLAGLWVVRPPDRESGSMGSWVAEQLIDSAAFDLVVLHGAPPLDAVRAQRLRSRARDRDVVLLVSGSAAAEVRPDLRMEVSHTPVQIAAGRLRGRVRVRVSRGSGQWGGEREVEIERDPSDRLRAEPPRRDRSPGSRP